MPTDPKDLVKLVTSTLDWIATSTPFHYGAGFAFGLLVGVWVHDFLAHWSTVRPYFRDRLEINVIAFAVYKKAVEPELGSGQEYILHRHLKQAIDSGRLSAAVLDGDRANIHTQIEGPNLLQFAQEAGPPELVEFAAAWVAFRKRRNLPLHTALPVQPVETRLKP